MEIKAGLRLKQDLMFASHKAISVLFELKPHIPVKSPEYPDDKDSYLTFWLDFWLKIHSAQITTLH